jgi:hypothetical protein
MVLLHAANLRLGTGCLGSLTLKSQLDWFSTDPLPLPFPYNRLATLPYNVHIFSPTSLQHLPEPNSATLKMDAAHQDTARYC